MEQSHKSHKKKPHRGHHGHHGHHTSGRVTYDPTTGEIDNPDATYDSASMEKTLDKLFKQVATLESSIETLLSDVSRIKKKVKHLDGISGRVTVLEADIVTANRTVSGMRNDLAINTFDVQADADLRDYMMIEKDRDATDTRMSGNDIGAKIEDMKERRRNHGMHN
jgi:hypothetical protein